MRDPNRPLCHIVADLHFLKRCSLSQILSKGDSRSLASEAFVWAQLRAPYRFVVVLGMSRGELVGNYVAGTL